jgi:hypothetical protein
MLLIVPICFVLLHTVILYFQMKLESGRSRGGINRDDIIDIDTACLYMDTYRVSVSLDDCICSVGPATRNQNQKKC